MKRSSGESHYDEQDAFRLVNLALGRHAAVRHADPRQGTDAVIELDGGQEIPIEFKRWGHDGDTSTSQIGRVWVLSGATRGLQDRLRGGGESFVDLRGTVFLSFPNLLVDRVNVKLPRRRPGVTRSFDPFADRASLVARTLLEPTDHQQRTWGARALAEAAGVSPATVSRIVRGLERCEALHVRRTGRESEIRVTDPRTLFTLWTGAYDWNRNQNVAVQAPIGDPLRFLRRSKSVLASHRWALTLHAGAALVAPHATWERIHAYVDVESTDALLELAEQQDWPVSAEGRLVLMKPYYRDSVWHGAREVHALPVVSDLQLALDLWHYPLRGREQSEHLISTRHLFGG